jgi:hypothetical protein
VDRRQFLRLTGGSAAAAALTVWLTPGCSRRVSGTTESDPSKPPAPERPLLLVLVPKDESAGYLRGRMIGGVLNHGGDAVLADLAGVDLVCSTADRLPAEARSAAAGDPWFVLLTRDGETVRAQPFTPDVPPEPPHFPRGETTWEQVNAGAQAGIDALAAALHGFLAPSVAVPAGESSLRAAEARKRYVTKPPPGAHWASSGGCGTTIEGVSRNQQGPMVGCGMGMVPEVSRRFLHFYVRG